ncbi:MAG TPA: hypothetical protein VGN80_17520 [Devosiaceae bacterium]|jgi:hypothetical protein|nr:hypothetical protein [Devosiaceae bacterium]
MPDPFAPLARPIPVTVTSTPVAGTTADGIAVLRLLRPSHDHALGTECAACAAQTDIRALLFDLLQSARQGHRPPFTRVVVDASALPDVAAVTDRLVPGKMPALGLRDHTVARSFVLHGAADHRQLVDQPKQPAGRKLEPATSSAPRR